jgi:molecular chaperone GrpE
MQNQQDPQSGQPELTTDEAKSGQPELTTDEAKSGQPELTTDETNTEETAEHSTVKPTAEIMPSLEELLKKAELDAAEHHDAWLRAKADSENIRKRAQIDVANAHKYATENFSTELLTVMDSLEAALAVENATVENFKNGMELTLKQLTAAFDKFNIKVINPNGEKFDPHRHEAMCMVDSDLTPNTVVHVMQKGYVLNDRVIRPALVTVSKAKET